MIIKPTTDKARAVATYVCLMLLWPMALAASQGLSFSRIAPEDLNFICSYFSQQSTELPSNAPSSPQNAKKSCIFCINSQQANAIDLPSNPTISLTPPSKAEVPPQQPQHLPSLITSLLPPSRAPPSHA